MQCVRAYATISVIEDNEGLVSDNYVCLSLRQSTRCIFVFDYPCFPLCVCLQILFICLSSPFFLLFIYSLAQSSHENPILSDIGIADPCS